MKKLKISLLILIASFSVIPAIAQISSHIELSDLPSGANYEGEAKEIINWTDKNGENYFIITKVEEYVSKKGTDQYENDERTSFLYAYHYIKNGNSIKLSRKITDFVKACEFDIVLFYEKESIEVTDLDEDGIFEVSFIYKLSCTSDLSPFDMKLMLLEDGNKYPIRGTTEVNYGDDYIEKGTKKNGAEFNTAPTAFKKFAEKQWYKFNSNSY